MARISVVGAGFMGSGIAQKYAMHGHTLTVVDKVVSSLDKSQQTIRENLEQGVKRAIFSADEVTLILSRFNFSNDLQSVKNDDLVIEAIFENLAQKQELFKTLDKLCDKRIVLATNTSSLKVSDLEQGLSHPERLLGLHYFFPPSKNRLVEIIATKKTSESALTIAKELQLSINKTVIHSKDSPGFIVNRFFVPWLNEALRIVSENQANIATVDKAAQTFFEISMGPFALMNATGLPITFYSCEALARALGDFYAPSSVIASQIEKKSPWDLSSIVDETKLEAIAFRLLSVVALICCQMVFDENVCTKEDVDLGANVGLMWKKGPFLLIKEHHKKILTTINSFKNGLPTSAFENFVRNIL